MIAIVIVSFSLVTKITNEDDSPWKAKTSLQLLVARDICLHIYLFIFIFYFYYWA